MSASPTARPGGNPGPEVSPAPAPLSGSFVPLRLPTWDVSQGARSGARAQAPRALPAVWPFAPGSGGRPPARFSHVQVSRRGTTPRHCSRTLGFGHGASLKGVVYVGHGARSSGVGPLRFGARSPLSGRGACGPRCRPRQPPGLCPSLVGPARARVLCRRWCWGLGGQLSAPAAAALGPLPLARPGAQPFQHFFRAVTGFGFQEVLSSGRCLLRASCSSRSGFHFSEGRDDARGRREGEGPPCLVSSPSTAAGPLLPTCETRLLSLAAWGLAGCAPSRAVLGAPLPPSYLEPQAVSPLGRLHASGRAWLPPLHAGWAPWSMRSSTLCSPPRVVPTSLCAPSLPCA